MVPKTFLTRGSYAVLLIVAFITGRLTTSEEKPDHITEAQRHRSLLINQTTERARPGNDESNDASLPSDVISYPDDNFLETLAEMVGARSIDQGAFSRALEAWVEKDPIGAIDFLARGNSRDDMMRWIVNLWSTKHPEESSRWLADNREMAGFDHAVEGLALAIDGDEPESALEWAKMIEDPAVRARVWISSGFQQFRHNRELATAALADSGLPVEAQLAVQDSWAVAVKERAQRNSQNLSSVAAAATAAGLTFEASSVEEYMTQVIHGAVVESGKFKGQFFGVPNLDELDVAEARNYLVLSGDVLAYNPKGLGDE